LPLGASVEVDAIFEINWYQVFQLNSS
jgi:hypothetical protein